MGAYTTSSKNNVKKKIILVLVSLWFAVISCFTQLCTLVVSQPSSVAVGARLPEDQNANKVVMKDGKPDSLFQLHVETWSTDITADSDRLCMAGVKHISGTVIWAANNALPVKHRCQLRLSSTALSLVNMETNVSADTDWSTPTYNNNNIVNMSLQESGNLVLQDASGKVLWQSFDDTIVFGILPRMKFSTNVTLYSADVSPHAAKNWNVAPGNYALRLHENGTLYAYFSRGAARVDSIANQKQNPAAGFVYWSFNVFGDINSTPSTKVAYMALDANSSVLRFYDSQSRVIAGSVSLPSVGNRISDDHKIVTIDGDCGHFTIQDLLGNDSNGYWVTIYKADSAENESSSCQSSRTAKHLGCGAFSLFNVANGQCNCPRGFALNSSGDCAPQKASNQFPDCNSSSDSYQYVRVANVAFHPQLPPVPIATSEEQCSDLCSKNCNCSAALYDAVSSTCALFSSITAIPTLWNTSSRGQVLLLKIVPNNWLRKHVLIVVLVSVVALLVSGCGAIIFCVDARRRRSRKATATASDFSKELLDMPRLPPRFTLKDLEVATQGFVVKLGSGCFGSVYEGVLPSSGTKVAVKKLEGSLAGGTYSDSRYGQTFRAELVTIGAASHVNLVKLKGFCIENGCRMLVYEFMANGSLDRWLFHKSDTDKLQLSWEQRFAIALDTAKGLAYLHHECGERIVHCDIKPENILLDEKFRAKVADFGLAKLMDNEKQCFTMTTVKGTRGYLAPEWLHESTITTKSDVYSFGVVLLELISGRRCMDEGEYLPVIAMKALTISARSQSRAKDTDQSTCASAIVNVLHALVDQKLITSQLGDNNRCEELIETTENIDEWPLKKTGFGKPAEQNQICNFGWDESMMRTMKVALWCVQTGPGLRPDMASVVQMMEGVQDVPPPPPSSAAGMQPTICDSDGLPFAGSSSASASAS